MEGVYISNGMSRSLYLMDVSVKWSEDGRSIHQ